MQHDFFNVVSTQRFREILEGFSPLDTETVVLDQACGRVSARDVLADQDIPLCDRATMDGYAVRAEDLFGSSEGNPGYLECIGEISIETPAEFSLGPGECAAITTGGCLPKGADSVVMVEQTQRMGEQTVEIRKSLAPGENIMRKGEDVARGQVALAAGTRLRPQEVGLLAAVGQTDVEVFCRPRVGIISTGDELVPVDRTPRPGQVRDVNSHALAALVDGAGGIATMYGLAEDRLDVIVERMERALAENDMIFLSGGSSVGMRDLTVEAIGRFPDSELLVHGVSVSPGKPTILAVISGKPVWGLPGQVTSAQVVMLVFGQPFLRILSGESDVFNTLRLPRVQAELGRNVASKQGREDYVRVVLEQREGKLPLAVPRMGKSGLLRTLVSADGLVRIDEGDEGLRQGTQVEVRLFG
ncbi:MAG: gephyrin-like molybdotransferase Glp [Desulfovibrio sp.]|uniref:molybdopterin molybdotransferase MoeA n=1 Tax=Desulfovibrio sp. 7SRBS1 TaxID=3378064 RepID=UPI003B3C918C